MKKVFLLLMCVLLISGCSNNKEEVKVIPSSMPTSTVEPTSTPIEKEEKKEKEKVNMNNYVSYNGNLKLDGVNLVNQYGEKIQLKGISSHGLQWFNYLITDTNIKTIKSWGSNVFRLAMYTKEGGYIDNKDIYNSLLKDIELVISNDMYVVIDWHILSDNNPNMNKEEAKKFFEEISSKYKNTPNIIYEICNEPNGGTTWNDIKSYADEIIPIIRKNSNSLIIVGTPTWSQDVDSVIGNKVNDNNTMYALHFYSGTHKEYLRDKAKRAMENGVPIFISEFGVSAADGNGGVYIDEANNWFNFIDKYNLSYINWSLADKNESSALLKENTRTIDDNNLSSSGLYIKEIISRK